MDLSPAPDWLRTLSSVMSYLDCGLNPLIYCSHQDFREAGLALLWTNRKSSSEPVLTSITKRHLWTCEGFHIYSHWGGTNKHTAHRGTTTPGKRCLFGTGKAQPCFTITTECFLGVLLWTREYFHKRFPKQYLKVRACVCCWEVFNVDCLWCWKRYWIHLKVNSHI